VDGQVEWLRGNADSAPKAGPGALRSDTDGRYHGFRGVRFAPLQTPAVGTLCEVEVAGLLSASGIPLAGPYRWEFSTEHGAGIQVVVAQATCYYYHNGQRVAMRRTGINGQDEVYWLLGDRGRGHHQPRARRRGRRRGGEPASRSIP